MRNTPEADSSQRVVVSITLILLTSLLCPQTIVFGRFKRPRTQA